MKILNRAKSVHTDNYPIGQWLEIQGKYYIIGNSVIQVNDNMGWTKSGSIDDCGDFDITIHEEVYEVQKETRAISFDDIRDSENNLIFMALNPNGLGGDTVSYGEYNIFNTGFVQYTGQGTFHIISHQEEIDLLDKPITIIGITE